MRKACLHLRATQTWGRLRAGRPIEALRRAGRSFGQSLRHPIPLPFAWLRRMSPWVASDLCHLAASQTVEMTVSNSKWAIGSLSRFGAEVLLPRQCGPWQRYAFETLGCKALWCGYYEGNDKSLRVQQKCGFAPHHVERDVPCELMGDVRTECFTYLTCEDWRRRAQCE